METPELCPKCGAPMVKKRATRGLNKGGYFWGCANYPGCRGIIGILGSPVPKARLVGPQKVTLDDVSRAYMLKVLPRLKEREQKILSLRFGIGCKPHTLKEIGQQLSISRERVRQLVNKIIRKINHPLNKKEL